MPQERATLQRGERVGWVLPKHYSATPGAGFTFYPDGESPRQWTERISLLTVNAPSVADSNSYLASRAALYRDTCPGLRTKTIFAEVVEGIDNAVQMWHCPEQTDDGFGTVVLIKAIIDRPAVHLAESSGRFAPYPRDSSPLPSDMLNSWAAFQNSFILCTNRLNPSCLPALGELVKAPPSEPATEEALSVRLSETRGAIMHRKDQLARRATEILGAQKNLRKTKRVSGWVTVLGENGVDVVWFMGGSIRRPRPYYAIVFTPGGDGRFYPYKQYKASDKAIAMFRARASALAVMEQACTPSVNTVVLQHESGAGWLVYVLSAGTSLDEVYIGGHTRYTVDEAGTNVLQTDALSESCLVLNKSAPESRDEDTLAWYSMTHLQHPTPLETHLFQSLNHDLRFFVHTSSGDWRVEGGSITKLAL